MHNFLKALLPFMIRGLCQLFVINGLGFFAG